MREEREQERERGGRGRKSEREEERKRGREGEVEERDLSPVSQYFGKVNGEGNMKGREDEEGKGREKYGEATGRGRGGPMSGADLLTSLEMLKIWKGNRRKKDKVLEMLKVWNGNRRRE